MPYSRQSARNTTPQIESLTTAIARRAVFGSVSDHLQQWSAVLGFGEDEPPGISLCVDESPPPRPGHVIPGGGQVNDGTLTFPAPTVRQTLMELYDYARAVRNHPISEAKGLGSGVLLETRYDIWGRRYFDDPVRDLLKVTCEVYATCLLAALREDIYARINATNLKAAYFDVVAARLGLSAAQKEEFLRLKPEYPAVSDQFCFDVVINQRGIPDARKREALRLRASYPAMSDDLCLDIAANKILFSEEEYLRLSAEYRNASSERKWEIFGLFRAHGWGDPY
jgi:hypothetical protein